MPGMDIKRICSRTSYADIRNAYHNAYAKINAAVDEMNAARKTGEDDTVQPLLYFPSNDKNLELTRTRRLLIRWYNAQSELHAP